MNINFIPTQRLLGLEMQFLKMTNQQFSFVISQMHAIAFAVAEEITISTEAFMHHLRLRKS